MICHLVEPYSMTSFTEALNLSAIDEFRSLSQEEQIQVLSKLRAVGASDDKLRALLGHDLHKEDRYEDYLEYRVHKLLLLYVPPFLLIFGTLGNLFSFLILRHRSMNKQSIYVYLSTLAIFDSLVLYFGLIRLWVNEILNSDVRDESAWLCKGLLTLGYTCSDVSVWLIVVVTLERYLVVSHPLRANYFCQDVRAKRIAAGLVVLFLLVNVHFLFSTDLKQTGGKRKNEEEYRCQPTPGFETLIYIVWPWVDALLYGFGPFLLILIFNSIIIIKICQANSSRAKLVLGRNCRQNSSSSDSGNVRITVMLLTISFTFLLTTLPNNLAKIIAYWINETPPNNLLLSRGMLFDTLATLLMYLNHSVNFLLYCATGRKFRAVVTRCFCAKLLRPLAAPAAAMDHSQHLFCSKKRSGDGQRSSKESQESQV